MNVKRVETLFINSKNRSQGEINDFILNLNDGILKTELKDVQIRLSVVHLCINRSYYTVEEGTRFVLSNVTLGTSNEYEIRAGYYDVNTFAAYLINEILNGWSISWDPSRNTYAITPPLDDNTYMFTFINSGHLFGFDDISTNEFSSTSPLISTRPIMMNIDQSLYIRTNLPRHKMGGVDNLKSSTFTESDILCVVPMRFSPFDNITIDPSNQFVYYLSVNEVHSLRLYVTDQKGVSIPLKYDWDIALKFEFIELNVVDDQLQCLREIRDMLKYIVLHPKMS